MSLWVGLTRGAAETFLDHPLHTFNGTEGLPKGKGNALNLRLLLEMSKLRCGRGPRQDPRLKFYSGKGIVPSLPLPCRLLLGTLG